MQHNHSGKGNHPLNLIQAPVKYYYFHGRSPRGLYFTLRQKLFFFNNTGNHTLHLIQAPVNYNNFYEQSHHKV